MAEHDSFLGLWQWDTERCENAVGFYKFWGTLTDEEAEACATSMKKFWHTSCDAHKLSLKFNAQDTTRNAHFEYDITIDGQPHEIPEYLRERANNSIKLNPSGLWTHSWAVRTAALRSYPPILSAAILHTNSQHCYLTHQSSALPSYTPNPSTASTGSRARVREWCTEGLAASTSLRGKCKHH